MQHMLARGPLARSLNGEEGFRSVFPHEDIKHGGGEDSLRDGGQLAGRERKERISSADYVEEVDSISRVSTLCE